PAREDRDAGVREMGATRPAARHRQTGLVRGRGRAEGGIRSWSHLLRSPALGFNPQPLGMFMAPASIGGGFSFSPRRAAPPAPGPSHPRRFPVPGGGRGPPRGSWPPLPSAGGVGAASHPLPAAAAALAGALTLAVLGRLRGRWCLARLGAVLL